MRRLQHVQSRLSGRMAASRCARSTRAWRPMSWNQYQAKLARGEVDPIEPPQHA